MSQIITDKPATHRRWAAPALALMVASGLLVIGGGLVGGNDATPQLPTAIPTVATVTAEYRDSWPRERHIVGRIEAERAGDLAFEISGIVAQVLVDDGDQVNANSPLAILDMSRLEARQAEINARLGQAEAHVTELEAGTRPAVIAQLEAQLAAAEARRDQAQQRDQRTRRLAGTSALADEVADDTRFGLTAAEADVQTAQWRLEEARRGPRNEVIAAARAAVAALRSQRDQITVDAERHTLRAPFSGRIDRRLITEGSTVAPGQASFHLVEDSALRLRATIPNDLLSGIVATGAISLPDYPAISVEQRTVLPQRDTVTRGRVVLFSLSGVATAAAQPAPGDLIRLPVRTHLQQRGVQVPLEALREGSRGLWSVLVAVPTQHDLMLEARSVTILASDGQHAIIRGAIDPGDQIIAGGLNRVVAGMRVRQE